MAKITHKEWIARLKRTHKGLIESGLTVAAKRMEALIKEVA